MNNNSNNEKIQNTQTLSPAFTHNNIPIIFSSDEKYAPYLCVAIASLASHTSKENNYDICILAKNFDDNIRSKISEFCADNVSIRFIDTKEIEEKYSHVKLPVLAHFTVSTYFRIFIPEIFENFDKVLYLDCDLLILDDVAKLYHEDLQGHALGAVLDVVVIKEVFHENYENKPIIDYQEKMLALSDKFKYFQGGVLLLDIPKLKEMNFMEKCFTKLEKIQAPRYVDQDILNSVFDGNIHYFSLDWNVEWHLPLKKIDLSAELPQEVFQEYVQSLENPKIIHYCGGEKPWFEPHLPLAHHWWKYARITPYYEELLLSCQKFSLKFELRKSKLTLLCGYYVNKWLSKCTFNKEKRSQYLILKYKYKELLEKVK